MQCSTKGLNDAQENKMRDKVVQVQATLSRLNSLWKQHANNEGDSNSHSAVVSAWHKRNSISAIQLDDGSIMEDKGNIEEAFINFF